LRVSASGEPRAWSNSRSIIQVDHSNFREFPVKVFNSSVENFVEKRRARFNNLRHSCVSSSLHNFRCTCSTWKQKSKIKSVCGRDALMGLPVERGKVKQSVPL
jgi:hypothetical protein